MVGFECVNFRLGGRVIGGLVRKVGIRDGEKEWKILRVWGRVIGSLWESGGMKWEREELVGEGVDGLGERDCGCGVGVEGGYFLLEMGWEILGLSVLMR